SRIESESPRLIFLLKQLHQVSGSLEFIAVIKNAFMHISENQLTFSRCGTNKIKCRVNCLFAKVIRHPFPNKESAIRNIKARSGQHISNVLLVKINLSKDHVLQAFAFGPQGAWMINFINTSNFYAQDSIGTTIESGSQNDNLLYSVLKSFHQRVINETSP